MEVMVLITMVEQVEEQDGMAVEVHLYGEAQEVDQAI